MWYGKISITAAWSGRNMALVTPAPCGVIITEACDITSTWEKGFDLRFEKICQKKSIVHLLLGCCMPSWSKHLVRYHVRVFVQYRFHGFNVVERSVKFCNPKNKTNKTTTTKKKKNNWLESNSIKIAHVLLLKIF
jgi:hypothetical protein